MTRFTRTAFSLEVDAIGSISGLPVAGYVTTLYGVRDELHPVGHGGIDIAADEGTPVYAPAPGIVSFTSKVGGGNPGWESIFGNSVIIAHGDCYSLYAHLQNESRIGVGTEVDQGTYLGAVGSTGFSTGPHLHWAVAPRGNPYLNFPPAVGPVGYLIDPISLIEDAPPAPQGEFYVGEEEVQLNRVVNSDAIAAIKQTMSAVGQQDGEYVGVASGPVTVSVPVPAGYRLIGALVKE